MALAMKALAPSSLRLRLVELDALPLFNPDLEAETPLTWRVMRDAVRQANALLFVTPEHNRSVPAALKNALDIGSQPYGSSVWNGKPGAIVSVSPGAMGGFGANHHLRQALVFLNVPVLQQPEAYIAAADKLFDEQGQLVSEQTKCFLQNFLGTFESWARLHTGRWSVQAGRWFTPSHRSA
jgi:chromate reductase